jgi:hypothetical protein
LEHAASEKAWGDSKSFCKESAVDNILVPVVGFVVGFQVEYAPHVEFVDFLEKCSDSVNEQRM